LTQAWQATPPASQSAPQSAPQAQTAGIGVLLINLGTPEAPTAAAVRTYLTEFLNDKRVIEDTSLRWRIVKSLVLRLRPRRKARDYAKIWDRAHNESPLKIITRAQAEKLASVVAPLSSHVTVEWAMRYGKPSIASKLDDLIAHGCDRILIVPLYPQYAAATTATACDEVFRALMRMRRQPAVRVAAPYFDDPVYIEALASSLKAAIRGLGFEPEMILASYHGIPVEYAKKGDPYPKHCEATTRLLREKLGLDESSLLMSYQSRFGRAEWLEPSTDQTVKRLARNGVKNLVVLTPGFSADCLETLEEIAIENGRLFKRHGGRNFAAIPCLNDSEPGVQVIREVVLRELKGWM
jgi:ferrochelatase